MAEGVTVARLVAQLAIDKAAFSTGVKQAEGEFKGLESQAARTSTAVGGIFGTGSSSLASKALPVVAGLGAIAAGLGDATKAAADEEVGVARLSQALQDNVEGFRGNTDAVEAAIASRSRLAIADDKARDSISSLITHTHDITKALELMDIASDLARGRNIDLATATTLVGKVYDGNTAILKRYGIAVKEGATAQEALNEIQKTFAGQSEAYANTAIGSIERLNISWGNLIETIGGASLKAEGGAANWLSDRLDTLTANLDKIGTNWHKTFTNALDMTLEDFNAAKVEFIRTGGVAGQGWSTSLVAAIGAGKENISTAIEGNLSIADVTEEAVALGGRVGEGYVLYMADGVAKQRPALANEIGFTQAQLQAGIDKLLEYQTLAGIISGASGTIAGGVGKIAQGINDVTFNATKNTNDPNYVDPVAANDKRQEDRRVEEGRQRRIFEEETKRIVESRKKNSAIFQTAMENAAKEAAADKKKSDAAIKKAMEGSISISGDSSSSRGSAVSGGLPGYLDFFTGLKDYKTDVTGQMNLFFDNLGHAFHEMVGLSAKFKNDVTPDLMRVAGNIGGVGDSLNKLIGPALKLTDVSNIADYDIDSAFDVLEHVETRTQKLAKMWTPLQSSASSRSGGQVGGTGGNNCLYVNGNLVLNDVDVANLIKQIQKQNAVNNGGTYIGN